MPGGGRIISAGIVPETLRTCALLQLANAFELAGVGAMLPGVLVALRRARRRSPVHPAPSIRHRGRLALCPSPGAGKATLTEVHRQFALHGVVPQNNFPPLTSRALLNCETQNHSKLDHLCAGGQ